MKVSVFGLGKTGLPLYEARKFANYKYCYIHLPSTGVRGHCIPNLGMLKIARGIAKDIKMY